MKITIIGLGLIGGSIGLALKSKWPDIQITGLDINPGVVGEALSGGIIDRTAPGLEEACPGADFVFVATPVSAIPDILTGLAAFVGPETIITDVGSAKCRIVETAERVLPPAVNFIGGHPMAGSELQGLQAATGTLLKESVYVLTPTKRTSPEAFQKLHALLAKLGSRVIALSPEKHDEVVAAVSHLPHVMATVLVNLVASVEGDVENRLLFAAGGFRDMTRIAAGNPALWVDICLENKSAIAASIDKLIKAMGSIKDIILTGDREALLSELATAKDRRTEMSIGEPAAGAVREIDVLVSDRPGTISQIAQTFGALGINIEDIQVVPLSGDRGIIKLVVNDNRNIDKVLDKLKDYGYEIIIRR